MDHKPKNCENDSFLTNRSSASHKADVWCRRIAMQSWNRLCTSHSVSRCCDIAKFISLVDALKGDL